MILTTICKYISISYINNEGTGSDGIVSAFANKAGHLTGYASLVEDGAKVGSRQYALYAS
jgi:hypothetical protein